MPLETVARDVVWSVTGKESYRGQDSMLWLLAWTFDPQAWMAQALIVVGPAELRSILELPADRSEFSYDELMRHEPLWRRLDALPHDERKKSDPLESKLTDIQSKLAQLRDVFENSVIRPVPNTTEATGAWAPTEMRGSPGSPDKPTDVTAVQTAWLDMQSAFLADNPTLFSDATKRLTTELAKLPAAYRPSDESIKTELHYNRLRPYSRAWKIMAAGALLALLAVWVQRRSMDVLAAAIILAGFGMLSYGMYLRGQIAGRLPAANMFESLLFMSWGAGAFAIAALLFMRDRLVPLTASIIGALSLLLADVLPIDHFIRPIAPVLLNTAWMSIHVPGIMISYAVLALAVLIAHTQIFAMSLAPGRRALIDKLESLHYWYMYVGTFLLGVGIITGSMWAASSWGRYWGWDPKEVWSLVAMLAYLVIMHVRLDRETTSGWVYVVGLVLAGGLCVVIVPKLMFAPAWSAEGVVGLGNWLSYNGLRLLTLLGAVALGAVFVLIRGRFAVAFKSAVAFWFIIMTYVGVNYVLGIGLHSYGFGTGAVVHWMLWIGSIDLVIVGLLTIIYLARSGGITSRGCSHTITA